MKLLARIKYGCGGSIHFATTRRPQACLPVFHSDSHSGTLEYLHEEHPRNGMGSFIARVGLCLTVDMKTVVSKMENTRSTQPHIRKPSHAIWT